jgi:hypothetical protein
VPSSLEDHSRIELEEAAMGHVIIGMDPHKHSATIEVMAGLLAVQNARLLGAGRVIAAGRDQARLARAAAYGATAVPLPGARDAAAAALASALGGTAPGLVLDFVWGAPAEAAFAALARRGLEEDDADISYVQIGALAGPRPRSQRRCCAAGASRSPAAAQGQRQWRRSWPSCPDTSRSSPGPGRGPGGDLPTLRGNGRLGSVGQPRRADRRGPRLRQDRNPIGAHGAEPTPERPPTVVHGDRTGKLDCHV